MKNSKFVLISESGYSPEHDDLLESVLNRGFELFCVVGKDCKIWEEVMDELAVGDGTKSRHITTTSHQAESEKEVMEFVAFLSTDRKSGIEIVRV